MALVVGLNEQLQVVRTSCSWRNGESLGVEFSKFNLTYQYYNLLVIGSEPLVYYWPVPLDQWSVYGISDTESVERYILINHEDISSWARCRELMVRRFTSPEQRSRLLRESFAPWWQSSKLSVYMKTTKNPEESERESFARKAALDRKIAGNSKPVVQCLSNRSPFARSNIDFSRFAQN